ncbi:MAG: hypothetical protein A2X53_06715 [Candidatus Rokubacteria bacterium GWA2_70_23]|nr:MAG: hypothetical protein A2X53_06715 [Candidatus Rokubacteria bacterium GWA2_70_23]
MNLGTLLPRHARYRPDHLAVVLGEHRFTWRAFNARVNRLANALLREGLRKGDKIATVLPNCLELLEIYMAAAKTGLVVVPASPLSRSAASRRCSRAPTRSWSPRCRASPSRSTGSAARSR